MNRILSRSGLVTALFSVTLFVNAALLFSVQPMFSKMVLPMLGGTPAVWNTCMLFFQTALLGGYLYAHLTTRWLDVRKQSILQLVLFALTFLTLPVSVAAGWRPTGGEMPVWWLVGLLTVSLGAPFLMLSTGAPLLQRWFSESGHPSAANPYFLYAASNLGSMVALVSYPFLIEPTLRLADQRALWTGGYILLVLLIAACALIARRGAADGVAISPDTVSRAVAADATAADVCHIPADLLNDGTHWVELLVVQDDATVVCQVDEALVFRVEDSAEGRGAWFGRWPGTVRPRLAWESALVAEGPATGDSVESEPLAARHAPPET